MSEQMIGNLTDGDPLREYLAGLTEAELDEAEKIEDELNALLREGLSERSAIAFIRAVLTARKIVPEARVENAFESVMVGGSNGLYNFWLRGGPNANRSTRRARSKAKPRARLVK